MHEVGPYDGFVFADGRTAKDLLGDSLPKRGLHFRVIGDAFAPRSLQHALLEGRQCGREI